jgi:nucleoside-diphosphate-sugar epimerase
MEMQKSILVIGATGYLGGKVVHHLLKQNVKFRLWFDKALTQEA